MARGRLIILILVNELERVSFLYKNSRILKFNPHTFVVQVDDLKVPHQFTCYYKVKFTL